MASALSLNDPNSYSEPEKCLMKSLSWDFTIDFASHVFRCEAELEFEVKAPSDELRLDVRDLSIEKINLKETGEKLPFKVSNPGNTSFGQLLSIDISSVPSNATSLRLKVGYSTSPEASALCWMGPEQTAGKRQPFLYSQCQAIHARSLLPCQDSPGVKFPYTARVTAPKEVTVLMSAIRKGAKPAEGQAGMNVTQFEMEVPVPSYLVAVVAGDLKDRELSPRSCVWSEPEMLDACQHEFAETEKMLTTAESLCGPYVWGRYDLLVLPPSFPYGGMENPCLTFVTPTLLAGDRSLADVIAHEITHSWTGNLVTNSNFEHFWLNEGHTRFVECKIVTALAGDPLLFDYKVHNSFEILKNCVETLREQQNFSYTKLVPDLKGVDPDDAFSSIPYEKGFALLNHLQNLMGGEEVFNPFLRAYIEKFKYKSIVSEDWKNFLYQHFSSAEDKKKLDTVDWAAWMDGEGLPPYEPQCDLKIVQPVLDLAQRWAAASDNDLNNFCNEDLKDQPSLFVQEFLAALNRDSAKLSLAKVKALQQVYQFNSVRNAEVRFLWLKLCCQAQWAEQLPLLIDFVNSNGRMKFVRPIYRALHKWGGAAGQAAADNFLKHRREMHSTTATLVAKDLKVDA